jgi:hypothetical protein
MSKKALSDHFLVSLILGVLIFGLIITKGCGFISLGNSYRQDILSSFSQEVKTLSSSTQGYISTQMILKLGDDDLFFGIAPNADMVKYGAYYIERPATCNKEKTCICYCDKSKQNQNSVICSSSNMECTDYSDPKFRMMGSSEEFFGSSVTPGIKMENGFMVSKYLTDMPTLEFRNDVKLQRLSTGEYVVCMKKELCIDETSGVR